MREDRLERAIALLRRHHYPEVADFLEDELDDRQS